MTALLDSSMLIGLTKRTDPWYSWAEAQFTALKQQGPLILLDIVYAEVFVGMVDKHAMDSVVFELGLQRYPGNDEALFRAGQAFRLYKKRKGPNPRVLPDMIIGAVADIERIPLVTANPSDITSYFPSVRLISPP
jgi:predicted nucleic acid-binding protein